MGYYPNVGSSVWDLKAQVLDHEKRIGKQLDIVHSYAGSDKPPLSATDKYFVNRDNTILFVTWKPSNNWAAAGGSSASINAYIDKMADSIKSVAPKKIMLSIFHEPENDVSGGASGCSSYVGNLGTPAQYRAMWRNVYNRLNAKGVNNVVWVMNYMGYTGYNCMIDDLWPGNDIVDWIMWDPYSEKASWNQMISPFYDTLTSHSDAQHNYASKTWGLAEWGAWKNTTRTNTYNLYDGGRAALNANTFPKLKAYVVFDYFDVMRVAYDANGTYDATEMAKYKQFANAPAFSNPVPPTPAPTPTPAPDPTPTVDTTPPVTALTTPKDNATVSGSIKMGGTATDNRGIKTVSFVVDDSWVASDTTSPFSITLDTKKYSDGEHKLRLRAWDVSGHHTDSKTITIKIKNASDSASTTTTPTESSGGPQLPFIGNKKPKKKPVVLHVKDIEEIADTGTVPLSGVIKIEPSKKGKKVTVKVDDKEVSNGEIDSTKLTDGTHTLKVTEDGKTHEVTFQVDNPWYLQASNEVVSKPGVYVGGAGSLFATIGLWIVRRRIPFLPG